jgi:enamine deaminase RidA (YjgF/YER057c/UK114 family)
MTAEHINPEGMHRNPAFSQAVLVASGARLLFIGGQNAVNEAGEIVGKGDLAAQTRQVFRNLRLVLKAGGAELTDIAKWTIYVVAGQDFREGYAVFQEVWPAGEPPPAISAMQVAGLAHPDFLVELEAVAVVPERW